MVKTVYPYPFLVLLHQLLYFFSRAFGDQVEISLDGDSWTLSDSAGRVKAIEAHVPGTVHLDLMCVRHTLSF